MKHSKVHQAIKSSSPLRRKFHTWTAGSSLQQTAVYFPISMYSEAESFNKTSQEPVDFAQAVYYPYDALTAAL